MSKPAVSIIVPVFNDGKRLPRAVASALAQGPQAEVIIVDDVSTDDTPQVARALADQEQVRFFSLEQNSGPAVARNFGARQAEGKYLCFLDSDDEFLPGYLEEALPFLESNPEVHALKVNVEFQDLLRGNVLPEGDKRYAPLLFSLPGNVMVRRATFLKLGGFPEDPVFRGPSGGEDVAFCSALAECFPPLARLNKVYYRYWSQTGSHLDKFLANTRQVEGADGFEFMRLSEDQQPGGKLALAIADYIKAVASRAG